MIELIDSIKDPSLRAFVFRTYNNMVAFTAVSVPMVAAILLDYIVKNDVEKISQLFVWEAWDRIVLVIIMQLASAMMAGAFKVKRAEEARG